MLSLWEVYWADRLLTDGWGGMLVKEEMIWEWNKEDKDRRYRELKSLILRSAFRFEVKLWVIL